MSTRDTLIIRVEHGGLGDHLFHSHLPRIARQCCGYSRVMVSNASEYRDPAYRRLVWELNPFVDGFTDDSPDMPELGEPPDGMNLLDHIMHAHGLDDGELQHEPEVYYKPRTMEEWAGRALFDPHFVSFVGDISPRRLRAFLRAHPPDLISVFPGPSVASGGIDAARVAPRDVFEYCDLITSVSAVYCLASGGATLAAALGVHATVLYGTGQKRMFHHSALHRYVDLGPTAVQRTVRLARRIIRGRT